MFSLQRGVINGSQRQRGRTHEQVIGIFNQARGPFRRGNDFRHANPAVLVRIQQRQGFAVKFQTRRGAGERHPQLLIQFTQMGQVGAVLKRNLVKISRTEKLPFVVCVHALI